MEVAFHGQPCGIILAKTMALAHSAAKHVELEYQRAAVSRPVYPSIFHWREHNDLSACQDSTVITLPPNQQSKEQIPLEQQKKLKGILSIASFSINI